MIEKFCVVFRECDWKREAQVNGDLSEDKRCSGRRDLEFIKKDGLISKVLNSLGVASVASFIRLNVDLSPFLKQTTTASPFIGVSVNPHAIATSQEGDTPLLRMASGPTVVIESGPPGDPVFKKQEHFRRAMHCRYIVLKQRWKEGES